MDKDQIYYMLSELEEIRTLLADLLLIQSRIYDNLRSTNGLSKEDPTYEDSMKRVKDSYEKIKAASKESIEVLPISVEGNGS